MEAKKLAAEKAVEYIENGMIVGLGTGSTANFAIIKIGEKIKEGLNIKAVASSEQSEALAKKSGIPIVSFSEIQEIDIYFDGADMVDKNSNLIKGGGGALLREKILAAHSRQFYVMVDESKLVDTLGHFPLPVEITPFASILTIKKIERLGCIAKIRQLNGEDFITENGNMVVDCKFQQIADPAILNIQLHLIPGVVETGLLLNTMVTSIIVGYKNETVKEIKIHNHQTI